MQHRPVISIVDDDEGVRTATTKFLRLHGFVAHAFSSAEEFLRSLCVDDTHCLVTDVRMPGMSGPALHDHLRMCGHEMPTIFITAFPEEGFRASGSKCPRGACFLTKPFDGQALIDSINEALNSNRNPCDPA